MPVTKMSVSLSPHLLAQVEERVEYTNVSGALARILERYFALLSRSRSELRNQLSKEECALVLDATNGSAFVDTVSLGMLWAEIEDAVSLDHLDRKWQVDGPGLVAKIRGSGILGQVALIDASERWWRRVAAGEQPGFAELLADRPAGLPNPRGAEDSVGLGYPARIAAAGQPYPRNEDYEHADLS